MKLVDNLHIKRSPEYIYEFLAEAWKSTTEELLLEKGVSAEVLNSTKFRAILEIKEYTDQLAYKVLKDYEDYDDFFDLPPHNLTWGELNSRFLELNKIALDHFSDGAVSTLGSYLADLWNRRLFLDWSSPPT